MRQPWLEAPAAAGDADAQYIRGKCLQDLDATLALPLLEAGEARSMLYLPPGHDRAAAAKLRGEGWRRRLVPKCPSPARALKTPCRSMPPLRAAAATDARRPAPRRQT